MYTNLLLTLLLIAWQSSYMNLCYSGMLEQLSEHCHLDWIQSKLCLGFVLHIFKQQIVSLFRSDLISVCIFFNIEKILSGSALLTGITQALANLDKTLKLSLSVNGSLWSAISCYSRNYSRNYTECKTPDRFPTNLTVTSGVIFSTRPGIYNCISFPNWCCYPFDYVNNNQFRIPERKV